MIDPGGCDLGDPDQYDRWVDVHRLVFGLGDTRPPAGKGCAKGERLKLYYFRVMKIFLIGFMGAGKSTLGKYAARHNDLVFLDLDGYIEKEQGREIKEIFAEDGEDKFRILEQDALQKVIALEGDWLVSCGGGTPCFFDNMEQMNATGTTMYLDLSPARLADRLKNAKSKRPLISGVKGNLKGFIKGKLQEREADYRKAQHAIPEEFANKRDFKEIVALLKQGTRLQFQ